VANAAAGVNRGCGLSAAEMAGEMKARRKSPEEKALGSICRKHYRAAQWLKIMTA
jgi:hypothetical protein